MDQAKVRDTQMALKNGMLTGGLGWQGTGLREGKIAKDSRKHHANNLKQADIYKNPSTTCKGKKIEIGLQKT